jgi:hypothetical protein
MDKYAHWDNFSIKAEEADFTAPVVFNTSIIQRTDGNRRRGLSYPV